MSNRSVVRCVPWLLLGVSLAVNLWLAGRARGEQRAAVAPGLVRVRGDEGRAEGREPEGCEARLARLLAAQRERLSQALRSLATWSARQAPADADEAGNQAWRDDEDQEDALCHVAKRHLREHWAAQREALTASLRKSLADEREQAKNLAEETRHLARAAGLGEAEERSLTERYAPLRRARLAAVLEAIQEEPPAFDAALDEALGLFADEDRLILELGGQEALRRLRERQREGRTVVAAIAAALAGLPWDNAIRW